MFYTGQAVANHQDESIHIVLGKNESDDWITFDGKNIVEEEGEPYVHLLKKENVPSYMRNIWYGSFCKKDFLIDKPINLLRNKKRIVSALKEAQKLFKQGKIIKRA